MVKVLFISLMVFLISTSYVQLDFPAWTTFVSPGFALAGNTTAITEQLVISCPNIVVRLVIPAIMEVRKYIFHGKHFSIYIKYRNSNYKKLSSLFLCYLASLTLNSLNNFGLANHTCSCSQSQCVESTPLSLPGARLVS